MTKTIGDRMAAAIHFFDREKFSKAEIGFREILRAEPDNIKALGYLGRICLARGDMAGALALFDQGLKIDPGVEDLWVSRCMVALAQGDTDSARASFLRAKRHGCHGAQIEAVGTKLGLPSGAEIAKIFAKLQHGQWSEGEALALRLTESCPWFPLGWWLLGDFLWAQDRRDEALSAMGQSAALQPEDSELQLQFAVALIAQRKFAEAEQPLAQVLETQPDHVEGLVQLAFVREQADAIDDALDHLVLALALAPDNPRALGNFGRALFLQRALDRAETTLDRAVRLDPHEVRHWNNLGMTRAAMLNLNAALKDFQTAIEGDPTYIDGHVNLAIANLNVGNFGDGWRHYEWRRQAVPNLWQGPPDRQWQGEDLNGRTILVYSEQGLGDTVQFARYAPLLEARGAKVILEVQEPLLWLLHSLSPTIELAAWGSTLARGQAVDYFAPLLSLPGLFQTTIDTIPNKIPYLQVADDDVSDWSARMGELSGLKVGIVWAGQSGDLHWQRTDRRRSLTIDQILPLLKVPGVSWVSLQKGRDDDHERLRAMGVEIADHTESFADFGYTAAMVANLDLVISVDTSVAHVAGAMAKPVWLLSRFDGCWRWLLDREDSPWYPTMRLFRQDQSRDWTPVVENVAKSLTERVKAHA
jgi:tetratricopeptide (TPR) repeat protein